jgi:hypothetical protein
MENVIIEKTTDTPFVVLDAKQRLLEIGGNSYPENALEFYQPVFEWLHQYFQNGNTALSAAFKLNYFNTSSAKCIMNIMSILQQYFSQKHDITIMWYYDQDDEDMLETGKAFSVDFSMPFNIMSY